MLYEIQSTGPARRLATQQVGYDQKGKSAAQRPKLQQHSQISFPQWRQPRHMSFTSHWGQQRMCLTSYPGPTGHHWKLTEDFKDKYFEDIEDRFSRGVMNNCKLIQIQNMLVWSDFDQRIHAESR